MVAVVQVHDEPDHERSVAELAAQRARSEPAELSELESADRGQVRYKPNVDS
jgi:hypothetical protein